MTTLATSLLALAACAGSALAADAAAEAPKPYTLSTCIVSGDKLGEMGDPVVIIRDGREIKFCCKGCITDFNKDPGRFLRMIDEAEAKTQADAKAGGPSDADHDAHHH